MSLMLVAVAMALASASGDARPSQCDILASHPDDPDRVLPGLEREEMNLPAAEATCRKQLQLRPHEARTAYHLGRAIYYQGRHAEALRYLEQAANAGYRQSIFVLGYVLSDGPAKDRDFCRAGKLWLRSAGLGHPWSGYHLVEKSLQGSFKNCKIQIGDLEAHMRLAADNITVTASGGRVEKLQERLASSRTAGRQ
jgi:TPR repeat protein